ncbi:MAG TPA: hypothetical protein DCK79_00900 [Candidatus Atribacteria bacterium]|nr:MAG: hypothetical protein XD75_0347 [Parcubacteria bacterium 33_209]HAJ31924.1 hypothetical protein [Candidatus Atribacteria bacterium]
MAEKSEQDHAIDKIRKRKVLYFVLSLTVLSGIITGIININLGFWEQGVFINIAPPLVMIPVVIIAIRKNKL